MVYVFGINVPLTEVLLILMLLLTAGIALVFIELRRLRQLIEKEKTALVEFETDLSRFEQDEGKMHNQRVNNLVQNHVQSGTPPQQLQQVMQNRGWENKEIKKFFK